MFHPHGYYTPETAFCQRAMFEYIKYILIDARPKNWSTRMSILFAVAVIYPIAISQIFRLLGYDSTTAGEKTFVLCIPLVIWLMHKINERWPKEDD